MPIALQEKIICITNNMPKNQKTRFLFLTLIGLLSASLPLAAEVRVDYMPIGQSNRCLPDAVGFQTSLQVQYPGTWSRILKVNWNVHVDGQFSAHAYCIYEINHQLYAYDSGYGQRRLNLNASAKYHPEVLGAALGREYYASANYLPGFDPASVRMAKKAAPAVKSTELVAKN